MQHASAIAFLLTKPLYCAQQQTSARDKTKIRHLFLGLNTLKQKITITGHCFLRHPNPGSLMVKRKNKANQNK
jgi:hypothetical protein